MKYLRFFAVAVVSCLLGLSVARAQNYEPMDTWPYLVQDFVRGDIRMTNGNVLKSKEVNFNIIDGKLHYIENDVIMSAEMVQVSSVVTESATYLNVWGRMMKVVASDEKGYVLRSVEVDKDKMAKTDIGYGISSATASSQNVTSLLGESATLLVNMDITQALSKRAAGKVFPTMETLYLKINSDILPATKKDVLYLSFVDKSAADAFFKANKIKWKNEESLLKVVDFIHDLKEN